MVGTGEPMATLELPADRMSGITKVCLLCFATGDGDSAGSNSVRSVENRGGGGAGNEENSTTTTDAESTRISYGQVT